MHTFISLLTTFLLLGLARASFAFRRSIYAKRLFTRALPVLLFTPHRGDHRETFSHQKSFSTPYTRFTTYRHQHGPLHDLDNIHHVPELFNKGGSSPVPTSKDDSSSDEGSKKDKFIPSYTVQQSAPPVVLRSPTLINPPVKQPVIGWGTWKINESSDVQPFLRALLSAGFRHIDTASYYLNEKQLGEALNKEIDSGRIKREDVFITSKLWNTQHHEVEKACRTSLADWNLKYFDQYLIHWPFAFKQKPGDRLESQNDSNGFPILDKDVTLEDTWRQMETLVEKGLARSIGVSNFNIERLKRILAIAKIPPAVNQVELHPMLPQDKLLQFCKDNNIAVTAYSPLGGDRLGLTEHPIVKQVAESEQLTPGQVLIAWAVTRGCIVIPRTGNSKRLEENYVEGGSRRLSQDSMNKLATISKEKRLINPRASDPKDYWGMTCFESPE